MTKRDRIFNWASNIIGVLILVGALMRLAEWLFSDTLGIVPRAALAIVVALAIYGLAKVVYLSGFRAGRR